MMYKKRMKQNRNKMVHHYYLHEFVDEDMDHGHGNQQQQLVIKNKNIGIKNNSKHVKFAKIVTCERLQNDETYFSCEESFDD